MADAPELAVFLTVTVIIGILVLTFIADTDNSSLQNTLTGLIIPEKEVAFDKVTQAQLLSRIITLQEICSRAAERTNVTLFVTGETDMTKATFFSHVKALNLCESLQSQSQECGETENVGFSPEIIELPHVVRITCDPIENTIFIQG